MTEIPLSLAKEGVALRSRELLPRTVDFQGQYSTAIARYAESGIEVHRRDPSEPRDVLCMDEGLEPESPSTVRVAGPVPILERTKRILNEKASEGLIVRKVFYHEACGALGLNLKAIGEEIDMNPDKAGAVLSNRFAKSLTDIYGGYRQVESGGLLLTKRPKDKHTGQIVYYDSRVAGLDPAHIEELDPGYVVSRGVFGRHAAREYTGLAVAIAFGASGLGNELTPETPLHLVGIAESRHDSEKIADELEAIRKSQGHHYAERISVDVVTFNG